MSTTAPTDVPKKAKPRQRALEALAGTSDVAFTEADVTEIQSVAVREAR